MATLPSKHQMTAATVSVVAAEASVLETAAATRLRGLPGSLRSTLARRAQSVRALLKTSLARLNEHWISGYL